MKILIWTDAPWCRTAYGRQCRDLIKQFKAHGHDVAVLAKFGLGGGAIHWHDTVVYPPHWHPLGVDALPAVCANFDADVVLGVYDVWAFPHNIEKFMPVPWIAYFPVDGSPMPERSIPVLKSAEWIAAYTRFGERVIGEAGFEVEYVPPGFDTDTFAPGDKFAAREELSIPPEKFVVTMVGANKGYPMRKSWPEALAAFEIFQRDKDDVLLYCHSTKVPMGSPAGMNFDDYIESAGIPRGKTGFPDQRALMIGVPDSQMAQIYRASDVVILPSRAEGFGFPVAEAQLCGCPVITTRAHALEELTINGVSVGSREMWVPQLKYWWHVPDPKEVANKLEWYYQHEDRDYFELEAARGRSHFVEGYGWSQTWDRHWQPFIEKVEAALW